MPRLSPAAHPWWGGLIVACLCIAAAPGRSAQAQEPGAAGAAPVPLTRPASDLSASPGPKSVLVRPASGSRAAESTSALARRLGLSHSDDGASVLLTDGASRVRVYPNTHVISFDGQDRTLRGRMTRGPQGVVVPGPAAALIEEHVAKARAARALVAAKAQAPKPAAAKPLPALVPMPVAPVAAPAAAPAGPAPIVADAGWEVAAKERAWRWIVLHHSDDVCGSLDKYHRVHLDKGWEHGCGYHFVIGNGSKTADGQIEVSQRWTRQLHGAHAKTDDNLFNDFGIGICLVGDFEHGSARPSAAQMRALTRLVQWLMDRYDLPVSAVRGHCHCKPTCCPGKNFPWSELRSKLREPASRRAVAQAAPVAAGAASAAPAASSALAHVGPAAPGVGPSGVGPSGGGAMPAPGLGAPPAGVPPAALPEVAAPR